MSVKLSALGGPVGSEGAGEPGNDPRRETAVAHPEAIVRSSSGHRPATPCDRIVWSDFLDGRSEVYADTRVVGEVAARLRDLASDSESNLGQYVRDLGLEPDALDPGLVLKAFWTAALCHDVGRAWQLVRNLAERLGQAEVNQLAGGLGFRHGLATWLEDELVIRYLEKLPGSCGSIAVACEPDHAGWSALLLLAAHRWRAERCEVHPRTWLYLGLAAEAVLRHHGLEHLDKNNPPALATFSDAPLAFLLQFADAVDQMRPQLTWGAPSSTSRRFSLKRPCKKVRLATKKGALEVSWVIPAGNKAFRDNYLKADQAKGIPALNRRFAKDGPCSPRGLFDHVLFTLDPP